MNQEERLRRYQERWGHAIGDDPHFRRIFSLYQNDLRKEMRSLLSYGNKFEEVEHSVINETKKLESDILKILEQVGLTSKEYFSEAGEIDKLWERYIAIGRRKAFYKNSGDIAEAIRIGKEQDEVKAEINKRGKEMKTNHFLRDIGEAKNLDSDIRKLSKMYMVFLDFIEDAIGKLEGDFKKESKEIIRYTKIEQDFLKHAEISISLHELKVLDKRMYEKFENEYKGAKEHVMLFSKFDHLKDELKKLRDVIETRLNSINREFKELEAAVFKVRNADRVFHENYGRTITKEAEEHAFMLREVDQYKIFLRNIYSILKSDEALLSKETDWMINIFNNTYYQLAKRQKLSA